MKQCKMKLKNKKEDFFSMLLGTLVESLLGNILVRKEINRAGEWIVIVVYGNKIQDYEDKMDV